MNDLTRHEQFLNHIADYDAPIPEPHTREEYLLREIADKVNAGGSGGGGGMFVVGVVEIDEYTLELNKTGDEILAAMHAKIPICCIDNYTNDDIEYQVVDFGAEYSFSEGVHRFNIGQNSYETDDLSKRPIYSSK